MSTGSAVRGWCCHIIPSKLTRCLCPCFITYPELVQRDLEGSSLELSLAQTAEVSLLVLNVQQLLHNASVDTAAAIAEYIMGMTAGQHAGPDVVVLTEVFDERSREVFLTRLRRGFHQAIARAGEEKFCGLGEDSGLMVFSRYPIADVSFSTYAESSGADSIANKGLLLATLNLEGDDGTGDGRGCCRIRIAATHTQAFASGESARSAQIADALARIHAADTKAELPVAATLLCGDLNFTDVNGAATAGIAGHGSDPAEYAKQAETIRAVFPDAIDCYRDLFPDTVADPGFTCDSVASKHRAYARLQEAVSDGRAAPEQERLDHVWVLRGKEVVRHAITCRECRVDPVDDLSDHRGLFVRFGVSRQ